MSTKETPDVESPLGERAFPLCQQAMRTCPCPECVVYRDNLYEGTCDTLQGENAKLRAALADLVVKATEYGTQEGGFVAFYLIPTGPLHRAMPLLESMGVVVRPGFDGRVRATDSLAGVPVPAVDRSRSTPEQAEP